MDNDLRAAYADNMPKAQFPEPTEATDEIPVVFRDKATMIEIYNEVVKPAQPAAAFSGKVQLWISEEAARKGWGAVYFPLDYPSRTAYAGAVFVKPNFTIT